MGSLAVRRLAPRKELQACIKDIWLFESAGGLSGDDLRMVVPNGSAKLMLYYRGHFAGRVCGRTFALPEHRLFVIGASDRPASTDFDRNRPFGCICIELHPAFAYRVLAVPQHELMDNIVPLDALFRPPELRCAEERLAATSDPVKKAWLLQDVVLNMLARTEPDPRFEYGVSAILGSHGLLSVTGLARDLGVSDRWLRARFAERLGMSPKTYASLVRFQTCFQALMHDPHFFASRRFYDFYCDQAHFIREFRRFIGSPPAAYLHAAEHGGGDLELQRMLSRPEGREHGSMAQFLR